MWMLAEHASVRRAGAHAHAGLTLALFFPFFLVYGPCANGHRSAHAIRTGTGTGRRSCCDSLGPLSLPLPCRYGRPPTQRAAIAGPSLARSAGAGARGGV